VEWGGWPDGTFERSFTHAEVDATQGLQVHWAMRRHCGARKGDLFSKAVEGGKKSKRTCLGIIKCDNPDCQIERAQIANWFETYVGLTKEARVLWMTRLPIAHAHTIFIAFRIRKDPRYKTLQIPDLFRKAWEVNLTGVPTIVKEVDVDKEYVESLEEEIFENMDRTGVSGNEQWGLDVGYLSILKLIFELSLEY